MTEVELVCSGPSDYGGLVGVVRVKLGCKLRNLVGGVSTVWFELLEMCECENCGAVECGLGMCRGVRWSLHFVGALCHCNVGYVFMSRPLLHSPPYSSDPTQPAPACGHATSLWLRFRPRSFFFLLFLCFFFSLLFSVCSS